MGKKSKRTRTPQAASEKPDVETKRARWGVIDEMARLLIQFRDEKKTTSQEDSGYGKFDGMLKEKQRTCPWLTMDMVTSKKTRMLKKMKTNGATALRRQQDQRKKVGRPKNSTKAHKLEATTSNVTTRRETEITESSALVDCGVGANIGPLGLNLNVSKGISGEVVVDFVDQLRKNASVQENFENRKKRSTDIHNRHESLLKDCRLTAGSLFKCGQVLLGKEVLELRREKDAAAEEKRLKPIRNAIESYNKRFQKYSELLESGFLNKKSPTSGELDIWLSVRKKKKGKLPTTVNLKAGLMKDWLKAKRDPLTLREYLLDQGKDETLVDGVLLSQKIIVAIAPVVDGVVSGNSSSDADASMKALVTTNETANV